MANATFGVNIIPKSSDVSIGTSDTGKQWTIVSPSLTGVPTAPTAEAGTNTTQVATTAFVTNAIPGTMTGATSLENGAAGLVPAPTTSDTEKFLRGDGTWAENPSTEVNAISFSIATTDWTQSSNVYTANVIDVAIGANTSETVQYDSSILNLTSGLTVTKDSSTYYIVFTTKTVPSGTITGTILSFNGHMADAEGVNF